MPGIVNMQSQCRQQSVGGTFFIRRIIMEIKMVSVADIIPYENNPRENTEAVQYVAKSIKEFGWKVPIVIDAEGVIITGHTRYLAAKQLGIVEIPCVVASDLSPEKARAYRLADNKVADYSIWDNKRLLEELGFFDGSDIFTGFELGGIFDETLDETENSVIEDNEAGVVYEIVFKSMNRETIDRIIDAWESMDHAE